MNYVENFQEIFNDFSSLLVFHQNLSPQTIVHHYLVWQLSTYRRVENCNESLKDTYHRADGDFVAKTMWRAETATSNILRSDTNSERVYKLLGGLIHNPVQGHHEMRMEPIHMAYFCFTIHCCINITFPCQEALVLEG